MVYIGFRVKRYTYSYFLFTDDKLYVEDSPIDSKKSKHDDRGT